MRVYPAIDLLGGKVVRLRQGRRSEATVYSERPGEIARGFVEAGAGRIHVVDLDGAFAGKRENLAAVEAILASGATVQLGGGVRDLETLRRLFGLGVERVVVGTLAARDPDVLLELSDAERARVVAAVDARDGLVFVEGWDVPTGIEAAQLAGRLAAHGVAAILYTDIARDGTGGGPNVEATARLQRALGATEVIASGGIGSLDHLRALAEAGVAASVVGRALYEGAFTAREALAAGGMLHRNKEGDSGRNEGADPC